MGIFKSYFEFLEILSKDMQINNLFWGA